MPDHNTGDNTSSNTSGGAIGSAAENTDGTSGDNGGNRPENGAGNSRPSSCASGARRSGATSAGARCSRPTRRPAGPAGTSPAAPGVARSARRSACTSGIADRGCAVGRCAPDRSGRPDGEHGETGGDGESGGPAPFWRGLDGAVTLYTGDALATVRELPSGSVDTVVTSPPYWGLRDYGHPGQYGLEATPDAYVETLRRLFAEIARVLAEDGTLWLNIGDSYSATPPGRCADPMRRSTLHGVASAGSARELVRSAGRVDRTAALPRKNLHGMPWRVAMALQADGWVLRNAIVWHKANRMPEPVRDRFVCSYELVFLFARQSAYYFDLDAVRVPHQTATRAGRSRRGGGVKYGQGSTVRRTSPPAPRHSVYHPDGKNPGDVWTLTTHPYKGAHFAVMPPALAARCIAAGSRPGGTVLDPFSGAGTSGVAALALGRRYIGVELSADYTALAAARIQASHPDTARPRETQPDEVRSDGEQRPVGDGAAGLQDAAGQQASSSGTCPDDGPAGGGHDERERS